MTWIDGLVAVVLADHHVEYRSDSIIDIEVNLEGDLWRHGRIDWDVCDVLKWSRKWHEYYESACE